MVRMGIKEVFLLGRSIQVLGGVHREVGGSPSPGVCEERVGVLGDTALW